jgi:hypothetical protein
MTLAETDRNIFKQGFGPELHGEICSGDHVVWPVRYGTSGPAREKGGIIP